MFTDDDKFVLEAISLATTPLILLFQKEERRTRAIARLNHEMRMPLVAIRGAAELMMRTKDVDKFFDHDYLSDVWSWSELMRRLLGNATFFDQNSMGVELQIQPTPSLLIKDVIEPAIKQAKILLNERDFSIRNITIRKSNDMPKLWVDRNQFQQVIFNLLSNSIKHCYSDPKSFKIEIAVSKANDNYLVKVRDWGLGIQDDAKDILFQEGGRTTQAIRRNIPGQGLGLWVVRKIVEAHDGKVELSHQLSPTEFTIYLPIHLEMPPSSQNL
jgi:signal transduction histidine kinase